MHRLRTANILIHWEGGAYYAFYWYQIFALDSVNHKTYLAHMEGSLIMQCIITEKQSNPINTLWWNKEKGPRLAYSHSLR